MNRASSFFAYPTDHLTQPNSAFVAQQLAGKLARPFRTALKNAKISGALSYGDCRHCSAVASTTTIVDSRTRLETTRVSSDESQGKIDRSFFAGASCGRRTAVHSR